MVRGEEEPRLDTLDCTDRMAERQRLAVTVSIFSIDSRPIRRLLNCLRTPRLSATFGKIPTDEMKGQYTHLCLYLPNFSGLKPQNIALPPFLSHLGLRVEVPDTSRQNWPDPILVSFGWAGFAFPFDFITIVDHVFNCALQRQLIGIVPCYR